MQLHCMQARSQLILSWRIYRSIHGFFQKLFILLFFIFTKKHENSFLKHLSWFVSDVSNSLSLMANFFYKLNFIKLILQVNEKLFNMQRRPVTSTSKKFNALNPIVHKSMRFAKLNCVPIITVQMKIALIKEVQSKINAYYALPLLSTKIFITNLLTCFF